MKKFSIKTLAEIVKASHESRVTSHSFYFAGVSTDSRTTKTGDCFFAIAGENFDGHDYVSDAFAKGAACAVVNTRYATRDTQYEILRVDDTVKALGRFAAEYRRRMNFKVVAITGSVGKTMTRQIIYHTLSRHYRCYQSPRNFNNNIGLPLALLGAGPEDKVIIVELGSNCPGEIAYLTRIAQPDIAVVTNVYPAHLSGFGNLQTIIQEKLSISEGLQPDGTFIVNADFEQLLDTCCAKGIRFTTFGKSDGCDIQARNITCSGLGSSFTIDGTEVLLPLPGRGNVENALAAFSVCSRLGVTIDDFAQAVKTLPAVPMRAEPLQTGTLTILNDCYNANPASMKNALDILADIGSAKNGRLVFICGDMAELGQHAERLHAELGAYVAHAKVQLLLAIGKFAKVTTKAAKGNADCDLQTKCFEDTLSVCNNLQDFIKDYDIVLVKGSRAAKLETAVEKLKTLFP